MAVTLSPLAGAGWQFFDNNGVPLAGGLLYSYAAGTSTQIATYTSISGNIPNANPIVLNSAGRVPNEIWITLGYGYKFVLQDANSNQIATWDNIPSNAPSPFANDASSIAYEEGYTVSAGSFIVGQSYLITSIGTTNFVAIGAASNTVGIYFTATGIGSGTGTAQLSRSVQAKLQESVSVLDFGADPTGTNDSTSAMAAAHATGKLIYYPTGTYKFSTLSTAISGGGIIGDGISKTVLKSTDATTADLISFSAAWLNQPFEATSCLTFKDFSVEATYQAKSAGAGISVTSPGPTDNEFAFFENVAFSYIPIGIDFKAASFYKVIGCNFLGHTIAGVKCANSWNGDAGDGVIMGCDFETNPVNTGTAGILQYSGGGLKIIGNKILGGTFGYYMDYQPNTGTSDLIIANNSFELMESTGIYLSRASGNTYTFKNISITGNQFALSTNAIENDTNTWLSELAITGNVIESWPSYNSNTTAISFNNLSNFIISGNNITGTGGTSIGISLVNPTNGKIGLNNYVNLTTPITQSGTTPAIVTYSLQTGNSATPSTGWATYGSLYQSSTVTVTFTSPFLVAPNPWDISLTTGDGNGTVAGIVTAVTTTTFSYKAISVFNTNSSTIYWTAKGLI